ncbi:MAG: MFS transporter [Chloroflexota bacterium]|nr:MFS transporter [Chloroflexota bacterium]
MLATQYALGFVVPGFVGRLPISMRGLGCVLLVSQLTGSYSLAGGVSAALALAQAVAGPRLGRLSDRHGQRRVILLSLVVHSVGLLALVFAAHLRTPSWMLFLAAALAGLAVAPLGSMVRARWSVLVGGTPDLSRAYALESVLEEVAFLLGPVLVTALSVGLFPSAGLLASLVLTAVGSVALAAQRRTEPAPSLADGSVQHSAIASPGLRVLIAAFVGAGTIFGSINVAMVALAAERGVPGASGLLLALFALGSLLAGLVYGARQWTAPVEQRLRIAVVALFVGMVPVALSPHVTIMAVSATLAGVAISPTLIAATTLVESLVPRAAITEGLTWLSTAMAIGVTLGAVAGGWIVDAQGARSGFLVSLIGGAAAVAVVAGGMRSLSPASVRSPAILRTDRG